MSLKTFDRSNFNIGIERLIINEAKRTYKIVAVGLIITIFILLIGLIIATLLIVKFETNIISVITATIIFIIFASPLFLFILLILSIKGTIKINRRLESKLLKTLEQACELIYGIIGKNFTNVQVAFIHLNNTLVLRRIKPTKSQDILLLLPHCLQEEDCVNRITKSIDLCQNCGKCIFSMIKTIVGNNYKTSVVAGGSIAREVVMRERPELVLAVSCEREMTSGIIDTLPLSVFGVLIEKPHGYCKKTFLNLDKLLKVLYLFTDNANKIFDKRIQISKR
ncbi:MAG: DUF116 domain-containing protein [bacterium]